MDCAFYALGKDNKGLTSDQNTGTRYRAAKAWDKIKKSSDDFFTTNKLTYDVIYIGFFVCFIIYTSFN